MFEVVKDALEKKGIALIQDIQVVDSATKDFRTEILKLKQDNVDAVFIVFEDQAAKCPAVKQLRELKFEKIVLSDSGSETAGCPNILEDVAYAFPKNTTDMEVLLTRFKEKYGSTPKTPAAPNAYDAAMLLFKIMREGNLMGEAIQKSLSRVKEYDGVISSSISFNEKGHLALPSEGFTIKIIRNGAPTEIE